MTTPSTEKETNWEKELNEVLEQIDPLSVMQIKILFREALASKEEEILREVESLIEESKLSDPNPYGTTVKVPRVNMLFDDLKTKVNSLRNKDTKI